ncbi:hypothetical protein Aspvir_007648 [Aspergillus viridinutans]|uniref:Uncharacterized protein n=1 Tax=Aspergillus viridinutans TaxID=75553 RepID=A0A9P3C1P1_ASPVI|nr:uncharacterized protein Aspvir_007648 [Aspergillus viridinutans]GIK03576.1 hypothetical protein Aspvir_007648 [Aspergillus viridinutans]
MSMADFKTLGSPYLVLPSVAGLRVDLLDLPGPSSQSQDALTTPTSPDPSSRQLHQDEDPTVFHPSSRQFPRRQSADVPLRDGVQSRLPPARFIDAIVRTKPSRIADNCSPRCSWVSTSSRSRCQRSATNRDIPSRGLQDNHHNDHYPRDNARTEASPSGHEELVSAVWTFDERCRGHRDCDQDTGDGGTYTNGFFRRK